MKIELLKTVTMRGDQSPAVKGAVIESADAQDIAEFKGLVGIGYAKETTKAATKTNARIPVAGAPLSGIRSKEEAEADADEQKSKGDAPRNKSK